MTHTELGSRKEHERLVGQILIALNQSGLCRVWSNPTGAAYRRGKLVRFGLIGSADILGLVSTGRLIAIEVKTGGAKQSEQQKRFEEMILKYGGAFFVARDVESTLRFVAGALSGQ